MFKTLTSLLTKRRTLNAELELDHLELAQDQLIMGLQLTWTNDTLEPLEIVEVMVHLFTPGKKEGSLPLNYHGRFVRIPYQKTVTKIAGATSFHIAPGATLVESIRFLTRDLIDLKEGTIPIELHTTVAEGTYVHNFDIKVVADLKLRLDRVEDETGALTAPANSSAFTRALRIAQ